MSNSNQVGAVSDLVVHEHAAGHDARNRELLLTLARHGVDLNAARSIDFFFVSGSESGALQLSTALKAIGLSIVGVSRIGESGRRVEY
jgi:Protein of unknown function (DUF1260).